MLNEPASNPRLPDAATDSGDAASYALVPGFFAKP